MASERTFLPFWFFAPYVRGEPDVSSRPNRSSFVLLPPTTIQTSRAGSHGRPAARRHGRGRPWPGSNRRRPVHARSSTGRVGRSRPGRAGPSRPGRAACLPWRRPASLHAQAAAASQRAPRLDSQERLTVGTDGKIKRTEGSEQTYAEGQKCLFRSQIHVYRD